MVEWLQKAITLVPTYGWYMIGIELTCLAGIVLFIKKTKDGKIHYTHPFERFYWMLGLYMLFVIELFYLIAETSWYISAGGVLMETVSTSGASWYIEQAQNIPLILPNTSELYYTVAGFLRPIFVIIMLVIVYCNKRITKVKK